MRKFCENLFFNTYYFKFRPQNFVNTYVQELAKIIPNFVYPKLILHNRCHASVYGISGFNSCFVMGNSVFHQLETKKLSQRQTTKNVAIKNVNGGCADQSASNKVLL